MTLTKFQHGPDEPNAAPDAPQTEYPGRDREPRKGGAARWLPIALIAALVVAGVLWRAQQQNKPPQGAGGRGAEKGKGGPGGPGGGSGTATVKTVPVTVGNIVQSLALTGTLKSDQNINLSSKISGRVASLTVREGDRVRRGQLLITLEDDDLRAQVAAAGANLRSAQVRYQQTVAGLPARVQQVGTAIQQAQADLQTAIARYRQALLNEPAQVTTAQSQVDTAEQAVRTAQARVRQARQTARQTEAETRAEVARAESVVEGAQAGVRSAQAGVTAAEAGVEASRAALAEVRRGAREQLIAQAQAEVNVAQAQLQDAETELNRARILVAGGAAPRSSVDAAQTRYNVNNAQLEAARQNLSLVREGATTEQVRQAEEVVRQNEERVRQAQQAVRQATEVVQQSQAQVAQAQAGRGRALVAQGEVTTSLAALAQAQSGLQTAQANLSQIPITRQETIVAREAVDQRRAALAQARVNRSQIPVARQDVQVAAAAVATARAQLQQAQVTLNNARIYSPVTGVVNQKLTGVGQAVGPGTSLLNLVSLDRVYFEAQVSESNLRRVSVGQASTIVVPAATDKPFTGYVSDIIPVADPRLHQFRIRITIPGAPRELTPGAFARGVLTTQTINNTLVVPSDSIITDGGQPTLLVVVGPPDKARVDRRVVKAGASANGMTQILGGVERGDQVIIGNTDLGDGDVVRVAAAD